MKLIAHDVDSHEMVPGHLMGDIWGEPGRMLGDLFEVADRLQPDPSDTNMHQPNVKGDNMSVDPETIWRVKGPPAPSAIDLMRRVEVLDAIGIDRQLVFPTSALAALLVGGMSDFAFEQRFGGDASMFGDLSRAESQRGSYAFTTTGCSTTRYSTTGASAWLALSRRAPI